MFGFQQRYRACLAMVGVSLWTFSGGSALWSAESNHPVCRALLPFHSHAESRSNSVPSREPDETRAQAQEGRAQRQQREQRSNSERERDFYQSAGKQQAQQQRDENRKWFYEHPRFRGSRSRGGSGIPYYRLRR